MRLAEIERGDSLSTRGLIAVISIVGRLRLPDAARVAFYHRGFIAGPLGAWTQTSMRGPSRWSVAERELMAALVGSWNQCAFCRGAHRAVAVHGLPEDVVNACLVDHSRAPISRRLRAALDFLEVLTRAPDDLTSDHAAVAMAAGLDADDLADVAAVATTFAVVTRYADALDFTVPSAVEFARASTVLLKRGYGGKHDASRHA